MLYLPISMFVPTSTGTFIFSGVLDRHQNILGYGCLFNNAAVG